MARKESLLFTVSVNNIYKYGSQEEDPLVTRRNNKRVSCFCVYCVVYRLYSMLYNKLQFL